LTSIAIHYMRPAWFREGIMGARPDPANLAATHVFLRQMEIYEERIPQALEDAYSLMQGEVWSPNGEARELIRSKDLEHTSMSVGDIAIVNGKAWIVASFGFEPLTEDAS
jgi:hypothetical protein